MPAIYAPLWPDYGNQDLGCSAGAILKDGLGEVTSTAAL